MNFFLKSSSSVLNSEDKFLITSEKASKSLFIISIVSIFLKLLFSLNSPLFSPITVGVHNIILAPFILISVIIFLKPSSYTSMSVPVPQSYLCQTSLIPMYIKTMLGFNSKTSYLYLKSKSETLLPPIPLLINSVSCPTFSFNEVMKPLYVPSPSLLSPACVMESPKKTTLVELVHAVIRTSIIRDNFFIALVFK